jgi:hypothetical protein
LAVAPIIRLQTENLWANADYWNVGRMASSFSRSRNLPLSTTPLMPSAAANRGDAGSARAVAGSDGIERKDGGHVGSEVCSMASWSKERCRKSGPQMAQFRLCWFGIP